MQHPMQQLLLPLLAALVILTGCATTNTATHTTNERSALPTDYFSYPTDKPEALVFFGYQCGPCYQFYHQELIHWDNRTSNDGQLVLVPVLFDPNVEYAARAFHAAEILGENPNFHAHLFYAYQGGVDLYSEKAVLAFARQHISVPFNEFQAAYRSDLVNQRMAQAEALVQRFSIRSTPSVIVNRKHLIDGGMVSSIAELFEEVQNTMKGGEPGRRGAI